MCASCFTRIDAIGVQSVGVVVAGLSSIRWLRRLWRGEGKAARMAVDWDESADFLTQLGHDPAALLGPRPDGLRAPGAPQSAAREPIVV